MAGQAYQSTGLGWEVRGSCQLCILHFVGKVVLKMLRKKMTTESRGADRVLKCFKSLK